MEDLPLELIDIIIDYIPYVEDCFNFACTCEQYYSPSLTRLNDTAKSFNFPCVDKWNDLLRCHYIEDKEELLKYASKQEKWNIALWSFLEIGITTKTHLKLIRPCGDNLYLSICKLPIFSKYVLRYAYMMGYHKSIECLLQKISPGNNCLLYAAKGGQLELVKDLILLKNCEHVGVMKAACSSNNLDLVKWLNYDMDYDLDFIPHKLKSIEIVQFLIDNNRINAHCLSFMHSHKQTEIFKYTFHYLDDLEDIKFYNIVRKNRTDLLRFMVDNDLIIYQSDVDEFPIITDELIEFIHSIELRIPQKFIDSEHNINKLREYATMGYLTSKKQFNVLYRTNSKSEIVKFLMDEQDYKPTF